MKLSNCLTLSPLIILVGCAGSKSADNYVPTPSPKIEPAKVAPGQEQTLFPFKVGNSWTYTIKTAIRIGDRATQGTQEATFKVTKVDVVNGETRATLDMSVGGKVRDRQVWTSNSKGIYQISLGMTPVRKFSTPIPSIVFPVEPGKKFAWAGTDGKAKMAYNNEIVGPQEVDTEEKRLSAIAVDSKGTSTVGNVTEKTDRTIWFAPGIGMVRIREFSSSSKGSTDFQLVLKSSSIK